MSFRDGLWVTALGAIWGTSFLFNEVLIREIDGSRHELTPERAIEMRVLLPDQYVRIETAGNWTKVSGFAGKKLLTEIRTGTASERTPACVTSWARPTTSASNPPSTRSLSPSPYPAAVSTSVPPASTNDLSWSRASC